MARENGTERSGGVLRDGTFGRREFTGSAQAVAFFVSGFCGWFNILQGFSWRADGTIPPREHSYGMGYDF
jgi:hypothetical protein